MVTAGRVWLQRKKRYRFGVAKSVGEQTGGGPWSAARLCNRNIVAKWIGKKRNQDEEVVRRPAQVTFIYILL
jgi:hypothetical protein